MKLVQHLPRMVCLVATAGCLLAGAHLCSARFYNYHSYTYSNGTLPPFLNVPGYGTITTGTTPVTSTNTLPTAASSSGSSSTVTAASSPTAYPTLPVGTYPYTYPYATGNYLPPPVNYAAGSPVYPPAYPGYGTVPVSDWQNWQGYPGSTPVVGYPSYTNMPPFGYSAYPGFPYPYYGGVPLPAPLSYPGVPMFRGY